MTLLSYGGLGLLRKLSRRGGLEVVPCHYSSLPRMFARGLLPCDVGLLQVSAPDDDGLVSLGIGVEYVADALRYTPTLIAEVNRADAADQGSRPACRCPPSRPRSRPTARCARRPRVSPTRPTAPSASWSPR